MKITLVGMSIIIFGIALILAYSSDGFSNNFGTSMGTIVSVIGVIVSISSIFIKEK